LVVTELKRGQKHNRHWVTVHFKHTASGQESTHTFWSDSPFSAGSLQTVTDRKVSKLNLKRSPLNNFDLGDDGGESKEILEKLIVAIRNNPGLTVTQATTWYDTNYPNALYRGSQLLLKMREWIEDEFGATPTWAQFKTYVIDNLFVGIDG
jgi:hypothetical protein